MAHISYQCLNKMCLFFWQWFNLILASTPNPTSSLSQTAEEPRVPKGNLCCSHLPPQRGEMQETSTRPDKLAGTLLHTQFCACFLTNVCTQHKIPHVEMSRKTQWHSKGSCSSAPHHPINKHPKSLSFSHLLLINTQEQISRVIKSSALPTKSLIVLTADPDQMLG